MTNVSKKIVLSVSPAEVIEHQVRFQPERFNSLIYDKGYDVWLDKALRCPCSVKNSGQALPSCNNCLGVGWIFIDRKETRLAIQGMKADVRYENWTRDTTGMARVTSRAIDKLAFMDRITLKDVEGYFNEIIRVRRKNSTFFTHTMYDILEIESIYLFISGTVPLKKLEETVDYTLDSQIPSKIILNTNTVQISEDSTLTIRYRHYQTYHVIDMNRDIVKVRTKDCSSNSEELKEMPINGVIRKSHYLFDNNRFDQEERLIENE